MFLLLVRCREIVILCVCVCGDFINVHRNKTPIYIRTKFKHQTIIYYISCVVNFFLCLYMFMFISLYKAEMKCVYEIWCKHITKKKKKKN